MKRFFIVFLLVILSGCGRLFLGEQQTIRIHSATSLNNAEIKINGKVYQHFNGEILTDKTADGLFVTVNKPGYYEKSFYAARNIHPLALAGDIFFLPGLIVDMLSGSFYYYEPDEFSLIMYEKD